MNEAPKTYHARYAEARAALQAAQEALDAVERRLEGYWRSVEDASRSTKGYLRDRHDAGAEAYRRQALEEAAEAVAHLGDALRAWWPNLTLSYWVTEPTRD